MGIARFYQKRTVTNVDELIPQSGTNYLICLSKEAVQIIRNYLSGPALWEVSYVKAVISDRLYETPDAAEFDTIDAIVSEALYALTEENMACMQELIRTQRMIVAALAGQAVDLTTDLPDTVDFTANGDGIATTLKAGSDQQTIDLNAIVTELQNLKSLLETKLDASLGNTDDLEEILDSVNVILGGAAILGV